ncbi:MAG: UDP-N-acetylmuramoyl-L-alanyl-D-glutamate--2,6-diaminopimelate ligase [Nitrospirae bacterium]|nr:UDP-N-acetylmuramoyl-L-alanyl-D-glutamate--2,6-diaminopimelate ligase [Nitrospirota bacterium]
MTILKLLEGLAVKSNTGPLDAEIKGIAYDSRFIKEGFLFVAVKGFSVDGHDYIRDAINRGAAAIVSEKAAACLTNADQSADQKSAAFIEVPDSRKSLALISAAFYGKPSTSLSLIGITGTNGKTTTSFITKNILDAGGKRTGLLGTICYITGDERVAASHTTPESLDLQRCLGEMVYNNMSYAVLEVSSHALALKRVEGCTFKTAAFTNFSQDHLDFHGTMDEYFRAKCGIFDYLDAGGAAVLNWDDPAIRPLARTLNCKVVTCGLEEGAMIRAEKIRSRKTEDRAQKTEDRRQKTDSPLILPLARGDKEGLGGLSFDVQTPESRFTVNSHLIGRINVYNILMSVGIAYSLGISDEVIQRGIENAKPVEGRFENVDEGQGFLCIVDYAHTDDALRKLIQEARRLTKGRVITVFGCGGNRDKTKRPLMGAAASELSDSVIVTSDNPRNEDPVEIIKDILKGISKNNYSVQPDRELAIKEAVAMAKEGDTLLIAGKGHEDYQEIKGKRHHFSDREVLREAIGKLK